MSLELLLRLENRDNYLSSPRWWIETPVASKLLNMQRKSLVARDEVEPFCVPCYQQLAGELQHTAAHAGMHAIVWLPRACVQSRGGYNCDSLLALSFGTMLGPYEVQSPLGAGGMGEV
jgi:hypothetical protein